MEVDDAEPEVSNEALGSFKLDLGFSPQNDDTEVLASIFDLSLPFEKMIIADRGDVPAESEREALAAMLQSNNDRDLSADVANRERVARPEPTIYLPGNKQRNTRSTLTIAISFLAVLATASVVILFAVKSQAATPEQQAFDAYTARQLIVAKADSTLATTFERFEAAQADLESINIASAAALAAVAGASDETLRTSTDGFRLEFVATVAEITVANPGEVPYVAPKVTASSTLQKIASGVDVVAGEATRIEKAQLNLDDAFTALQDARAVYMTVFADFANTIPAMSTTFLALYPDADQEWRDAVTNAVNSLSTAVETGLGATEMQSYAGAAFALQIENVRVKAERAREQTEGDSKEETSERPRTTPERPGTSVLGPVPPPPDPAPEPVAPTPDEPNTEPEETEGTE